MTKFDNVKIDGGKKLALPPPQAGGISPLCPGRAPRCFVLKKIHAVRLILIKLLLIVRLICVILYVQLTYNKYGARGHNSGRKEAI